MTTLTTDNPIALLRVEAERAKIFRPVAGRNKKAALAFDHQLRRCQFLACRRWPAWFDNQRDLPHVLSRSEIDEVRAGLVDDMDEDMIESFLKFWTSRSYYVAAAKDHANGKDRRAEH